MVKVKRWSKVPISGIKWASVTVCNGRNESALLLEPAPILKLQLRAVFAHGALNAVVEA